MAKVICPQGSLLPGAGKGLQCQPKDKGTLQGPGEGGQRRPPRRAWEGGPEEIGP